MTMYNSLSLQDCFNYISMEVYLFHDYSMLIVLFILVGVLFSVLVILGSGKFLVKGYRSSEFLEMTWTIVPGFLLMSLGVPSLFLMYYMEGASKYDLTVKVVGHQWYWSYEMSDYSSSLEFDSYMINLSDLMEGDYRLLEVDNSLVLPYLTKVRVLVSSSDVLHSWALPSLGLKVDACPGRLNNLSLGGYRSSSVYSQCSEICSVNHSFMPIHVEWVSWEDFLMAHST